MNLKFYTFLILFFSVLAYSNAQDLSEGLTAFYEFEDNLTDASTLQNDLIVETGDFSYSSFNLEKAIIFDGNSSLRTSAPFDNSSYEEFTISMLLKTTSVAVDLQTVVQGANMGFGVFLQANTGNLLTFLDGSSSDPLVSANSVADGNWHLIVVEHKESETSLFVDGVLEGTIQEPLAVGNGGADNQIFIGKSNLGTRPYEGELNNLRIYGRQITPCDKIDLMENNFAPETYFSFDATLENVTGQDNFEVTDGAISYESFGPSDQAIVFDGNTRIASIDAFDNSEFRNAGISFWMKSPAPTAARQTILQGANMGTGIFLEENTGNLLAFFDGSSTDALKTSFSLTDGAWHHIVAQNAGSITVLIIDGIFSGFVNDLLSVGDGSADNKWFLGQSSLNQLPFIGSINNLQIRDYTFDACQVGRLVSMGPVSSTESNKIEQFLGKISPNPSSGLFVLDFENMEIPESISVFDLNGKVVYSDNQISQKKYDLNLTNPTGLYFLKTVSNGKITISKLVKQ